MSPKSQKCRAKKHKKTGTRCALCDASGNQIYQSTVLWCSLVGPRLERGPRWCQHQAMRLVFGGTAHLRSQFCSKVTCIKSYFSCFYIIIKIYLFGLAGNSSHQHVEVNAINFHFSQFGTYFYLFFGGHCPTQRKKGTALPDPATTITGGKQ